jgi:hypothetical protein
MCRPDAGAERQSSSGGAKRAGPLLLTAADHKQTHTGADRHQADDDGQGDESQVVILR